MEEFGPVQVLVVGFDQLEYNGRILEELAKLSDQDIIRLIDLVVVGKDQSGGVSSISVSDLTDEQAAKYGKVVGRLMGLDDSGRETDADERSGAVSTADESVFDEETRWAIADAIPFGKTAAVALIEHRWATPLREAIREAGGVPLADTWIHPDDLADVGITPKYRKSA
jgi:hypothetical protein